MTEAAERPEEGASTLSTIALLAGVLVFFFVSGACGLVYQVVWTRKLVLFLGTTAHAVSTVLSVFFLGLGLGGAWGGRLADRTSRHLVVYGAFEILIGAWTLLFLFATGPVETLAIPLLRVLQGWRAAGLVARALLAAALLFVPVFFMGATLPLLARFVSGAGARPADDQDQGVLGRRIGLLYSVNTFGAVAGCFLAGFVLLPALGFLRATILAAIGNVLVGLGAVLLSFLFPRISEATREPDAASQEAGDAPAIKIAGVVAIVGFAMLALEVIWTRLLVLVFLGTTYAYTAMLTTLLCGIALGSLAVSLFVDRIGRRVALLGGIVALLGVACCFSLSWFAALPDRVLALQRAGGLNWVRLMTGEFRLSFMVLFVPTFLSGMAFPLAVKAAAGARARVGRDVGRLYAANTIGGVLGAIAGGFLLLPLLGAHESTLLLAAVLVAGGVYLMRACPETTARQRWAAILVILAPLIVLAWAALPVDVTRALSVGYLPPDHRVIFHREGVEGVVIVSEPEDETAGADRVLWINRVQATASIEKGVRMNRLQGVLPLLFDRDPHTVLFMCFGSGITAGALALHDFEAIDAVEISPDVIEAAPCFAVDNLNVIENPRLRMHIDDGRNFLLTTDRRYDVITFEPMPLAVAGVSTFYTREYYALCRARLRPGGIVSQWVPLHSLNPEIVRSLIHTFTVEFREYCAFFVNADLFLIGSDQPLYLDYEKARDRLERPKVHETLADAGLCDVEEVFASFVLSKGGVDAFRQGGRTMTDDRPWAEFEAPKVVFQSTVAESLALLEAAVEHPTAQMRADRMPSFEALAAIERRHQSRRNDLAALQQYYGGLNIGAEAARLFLESLRMDPANCNARYYLRELIEVQCPLWLRWREHEKVVSLLQEIAPFLGDEPSVHLYLARGYLGMEKNDNARTSYQRYLELGGAPQEDLDAVPYGQDERDEIEVPHPEE